MERNVEKYVNVPIINSHEMFDLAEIPSLVALILSIIVCFLLFLVI